MPWSEGMSSHGHVIPADRRGLLREYEGSHDDGAAMGAFIEEEGYLFIRGALNREAVLEARAAVMQRLIEVGEVSPPAAEGIYSGTSKRTEVVQDFGAFWKSICEMPALRKVTHGGALPALMETFFGESVRPFDFLWLRPVAPGRASAFHFDHVYMNRGSDRLVTVWTPLGDVPMIEGALLVVENSHRFDDLIAQFKGFDVDKDTSRPGHVTMNPVELAIERDVKLLSADFRAGDIFVFPMFSLHGSLDNRSPVNRVRLSCDVRYQPAADPIDERWIGDNPIAHGKGYGGLSASQPLTSAPIHR